MSESIRSTRRSLIAPMEMHALCIGPNEVDSQAVGPAFSFAAMAAKESNHAFAQPNVTEKVIEHGKPFATGAPLGIGVHLHWTLPEPLRHAVDHTDPPPPYSGQSAEAPPIGGGFPAVPNRWLVTRFVFQRDGVYRARRWVVESDRLISTPSQQWGWRHPSVPVDLGTSEQRSRYIGKHFPAEDWDEGEGAPRFSPLTALGYGDPGFAAFYPNCSTVFGFYDALNDLEMTQPLKLGYHVVGWYGGNVEDFLATDAGREAMPQLDGAAKPATRPECLLSNSELHEIDWNPGTRYLQPSTARLACAIGPSSAEALSVLLAAAAGAAQLEGGLNTLQFGELEKLGRRLDAADRFAAQLHEAGFNSSTGGTLWALKVPERPSTIGPAPIPVPASLMQHVARLSANQQRLDRRRGTLATARRSLYADWYRFQLARYDFPSPTGIRDSLFVEPMLKQANAIEAQVAFIAHQQRRLDRCIDAITSRLPAGYSLEQQPAPRFWQPCNPSLMLLGQDTQHQHAAIRRSVTSNQAPWRTDEQIVRQLVTPIVGKLLNLEDCPWNFHWTCPGLPSGLAATIRALVDEAALFALGHRPAIVKYLADNDGEHTGASLAAKLFSDAVDAFFSERPGASLPFNRAVPPRAPLHLGEGRSPWLPLQVQYEARFTPAGDEAADCYRGMSILSRHGTLQLTHAISAILEHDLQAPGLTDLQTWLDRLPLATQAMTGFNAMLLQMSPSGQLPVTDPYLLATKKDELNQEGVRRIRQAIAHENWFAPLPEKKRVMVRSGTLHLQRIRIVDSFGRFRDHGEHTSQPLDVLAARSVRNDARTSGVPIVRLPSRITQPARLHFRWLSAWSGFFHPDANPPASPVIGWVLLDNVDGGLTIFDADANPLGTLLSTAGQEPQLLWRTAAPSVAIKHPQGALIKAHPELRSFVLTLHAGKIDRFLAFRERIREALKDIQPSSAMTDESWSQLIGRPLALVRATLAIELKGGLAPDLSWRAVAERESKTASKTKLRPIPVTIGATGRLSDGLIAYWKRTEFRMIFRNKAPVPPDDATIPVIPDAETPAVITLLIDPQASVHARCDVLPVKAISLPSEYYRLILNRLGVLLRAGPLLTAQGTAPSPTVPAHAQGEWTWYEPSGDNYPLRTEPPTASAAILERQEIAEGWLSLQTRDTPQGSSST
ncbi:hypothetical protein [Pseudomonas oryzihabitans]|uniref:hypothetical protein n=1 Tax=Pseudomonas oryzihabitans TaxID=47885 RepID=UPI002895D706|nr:hypothetical protein [Pseudomonas oryzihabitans]MDT3718001.1 hypothetical protein [Pseudomonas oryzihabitans]